MIMKFLILLNIAMVTATYSLGQHKFNSNTKLHRSLVKDATQVNRPQNVTVVTVSSTELNATWEAPTEGQVPEYYYLMWSGEFLLLNEFTDTTYSVLSSLSPCSTYLVLVKSIVGNSMSDESAGRGITDKEAPPEPRNLKLNVRSASEILVSWKAPQSECRINQYSVIWEWQAIWEEEEVGEGEYNSTSLSYTIRNLPPYSNVTVCIVAVTGDDYGKPACDWTLTNMDKPGAPALLNATSGYGYSVVTWEPPKNQNGIINNYKLVWKGNKTDGDMEVGNVLAYSLPLPPCDSYNITVAAKTVDWGYPSSALVVTIFSNEVPENFTCSTNKSSWQVEWTSQNDCPVDNYEVSWEYHTIWSNTNGANKALLNGTTNKYEQEGFPNTRYNVCVNSISSSGDRGDLICCQMETNEEEPGAPALLNATSGYGYSVVTWEPPENQNGIINNYKLVWKGNKTDGDMEVGNVLTYSLSLLPCDSYNITVAAKTVNWGFPSNALDVTIFSKEAPEKVTCSTDESSWQVKWTSQNDCPVDNYEVSWEYHTIWSNANGTNRSLLNGTANKYEQEGLANTRYNVCVSSVSASGDRGDLTCCQMVTGEQEPGAPVLRNATSGYGYSVVTWDPPENQNGIINNYKLFWRGNETEGDVEVGNVLTYSLSLPPCDAYTITIAAKTVDWGSPSNATEVKIFNNEAPENVICSTNESSWEVQWTSNYSCPVDIYEVTWEFHTIWSNSNGADMSLLDGNTYIFEHEGFSNTRYNVCISSMTSSGERGGVSCCQLETDVEVPGKPILDEIKSEASQIHVSWRPPVEPNGIITSYMIFWKGANHTNENVEVEGTVLETDIDLESCATYDITVAAATSIGYGSESESKSASIENSVLAESVICDAGPERSVKLSWTTTLSDCPVSGFNVDFNWTSLWSSNQESQTQEVGPDVFELSLNDIPPYSLLYSCVSVRDSLDDGSCCNTTTEQEVPGPAENMRCIVANETSVNIAWTNPNNINGVLVNWLITWTGKDSQSDDILSPDTRFYTIDDLAKNTKFDAILQASTEAGPGAIANCTFMTAAAENGKLSIPSLAGMLLTTLVLYK